VARLRLLVYSTGLDPVTPKRRGGVPLDRADDATEIAVPRAPWDASIEPTGGDAPIAPPARSASAQGSVHADDAFLEPGTQLGEYRVEGPIGEGGMGVVYAAVHPLIGKRAAIKVLKKELCRVAFNVERFVDEARVVNQIGHPNIVDVFAFGQTADGRSYFVMEWLRGESLRERAERSRLDLDEICDVVRPLARALEAAHEQGVIHRDLKPDNVFLVDVRGEAPLVKLLDFGIAKLAREEHRMERTATGAMVGTPQYIAPEQAKGYAIDHRVDVYSLGGIMFELLTGRPPFDADNAMEMVAKHLMEPAPRASAFTYVPPVLDDLVLAMLAKDPAARPSLADVASVLEQLNALDRTNVKTSVPMGTLLAPESEIIDAPLLDTMSQTLERRPSKHTLEVTAAIPVPALRRRTGLYVGAVAFVLLVAIGSFFLVLNVGGDILPSTSEPPAMASPAPAASPTVEPAGAAAPGAAAVEQREPRPVADAPTRSRTPDPEPQRRPAADQPSRRQAGEPQRTQAADKPPRRHIANDRRRSPRPPPRQRTGTLTLTIAGAKRYEILIDGKPADSTSVLPLGLHRVEVRAKGYVKEVVQVRVKEGGTRRTIGLQPVPRPSPPPPDPDDADRELLAPGSIKPAPP
jgi:eukaryotic-like serine/threonine-protein kinase